MVRKIDEIEISFEIKEEIFKQLEIKLMIDRVPMSALFLTVAKMYIDNDSRVLELIRNYQHERKLFTRREWKQIKNEDKNRKTNEKEFGLSLEEKKEIFDLLENDEKKY